MCHVSPEFPVQNQSPIVDLVNGCFGKFAFPSHMSDHSGRTFYLVNHFLHVFLQGVVGGDEQCGVILSFSGESFRRVDAPLIQDRVDSIIWRKTRTINSNERRMQLSSEGPQPPPSHESMALFPCK